MKSGVPGALILAGSLAATACGQRACGGLGGRPPASLPEVQIGNQKFKVLDKGAYKAYYDSLGQIARILQDSNGDGRPDRIAHYRNGKIVFLVELDLDHDGWVDRWEHYDDAGKLLKVGRWRLARGKEDTWDVLDAKGQPTRVEYDDDGDRRVDRADVMRAGEVVGVEVDADRDGRIDRWQAWEKGRLLREDLDTDGDGKPDRRISYDLRGRVTGAAPLAP